MKKCEGKKGKEKQEKICFFIFTLFFSFILHCTQK